MLRHYSDCFRTSFQCLKKLYSSVSGAQESLLVCGPAGLTEGADDSESSEMDQKPFEGLNELKSLYPNNGDAVTYFPTVDLEVLLRSITTIIRMYQVFPQIHAKIETCYCFQKILIKSDESRNKRGLEVRELSAWFHIVSQQLHEKTFNASVIFVKKTDHGFHPESDFAECTVNFVD